MILYFSGTGNSLYAARRLAELTGDDVRPLLSLRETPLEKGAEAVGIVFPVYAWGMPRIVERVLRKAAAAVARVGYTSRTHPMLTSPASSWSWMAL